MSDHQCCGKCEKPAEEAIDWRERYMREVEGLNNEGDPIGGEPAMGLRQVAERQRAVIENLVQRLQTADLVIAVLMHKAGGVVSIVDADGLAVIGKTVAQESDADSKTITFRLVDAVPPVDTVQ